MINIISNQALKRREFWINEIRKLSGNFSDDFDRLESKLLAEINKLGITALIDHLRFCGNIPESYGHDSSEEKLYLKYIDQVLALVFKNIGLKSLVLRKRVDTANVEAIAKDFSFIVYAKSFRLSRTSSNQRNLKIQTQDSWKRGEPYIMVVYPIYRLPNTSSQIYPQAIVHNFCVFTYSHLSLLLAYSQAESKSKAQELLHKIFKTISTLSPTNNGLDYWLTLNQKILRFSKRIENLWYNEKVASTEAINISKELELTFLAQEREKKIRMNYH